MLHAAYGQKFRTLPENVDSKTEKSAKNEGNTAKKQPDFDE